MPQYSRFTENRNPRDNIKRFYSGPSNMNPMRPSGYNGSPPDDIKP